jgi:hypothetical protein
MISKVLVNGLEVFRSSNSLESQFVAEEFKLNGCNDVFYVIIERRNIYDNCNVSIPADTPREINNWLRDTGY